MKPTNEEIKSRNENIINNGNNSLIDDENIFKIPEIYKLDYRGKNQNEIDIMINEFNKKSSSEDTDEKITSFSDYDLDQIEKKEIARRIKERYAKESDDKPKHEEFDDSDIFDFEKVEFVEVKKGDETKQRKPDKKIVRTGKKIKDDKLYTFKIEELIELEKYLKSKIFGQDKVIEQYISNFLLNTVRSEENSKNLGIFFNFGPSGAGKNYILELIAEKLDFGFYVLSIDMFSYVEVCSLLGATDGFSSHSESIMENIDSIAKKHGGRMILVIDEVEKGGISKDNNGNLNGFLMGMMSILSSRKIYTKNNNTEIDLCNFIFAFNSNLGFDEYENKLMNKHNKIGFNIGDNEEKIIEKEIVDESYIENYLKNVLKVNISVFNRLKKGNNFIFFNHLEKKQFKKYLEKRYNDLHDEIVENYEIIGKLPRLNFFKRDIDNFDFSKGFRGINDLVFLDFKLFLLKKFVYRKYFQKNIKIGL